MKRIVVVTATRAEYGLLAPIIKKLKNKNDIDVQVVATGTHLSPEFGMTVNEIEKDGVRVDKRIEILQSSDTASAISKTMGMAMISFADYFAEAKPDALMVLGDRYETLAICSVAMNAQIPIIHLYGGEATLGAIDEQIRNAITKMSYLHFTSTQEYRKRVIQMGEEPSRVIKAGAIGVENALHMPLLSKDALAKELGLSLSGKYALLTFHPVTLEKDTAAFQTKALLKAIEECKDITFICTKANADKDGRIINELFAKYEQEHHNLHLFDSLGAIKYLSAMKYAAFVIGNSSSGIIEAPTFKIPTINIGDRQKGRIQAKTVINCLPETNSIIDAINKAISHEFLEAIKDCENPYGNGNSSDLIVEITYDYLINDKLKNEKQFYDINNWGDC